MGGNAYVEVVKVVMPGKKLPADGEWDMELVGELILSNELNLIAESAANRVISTKQMPDSAHRHLLSPYAGTHETCGVDA